MCIIGTYHKQFLNASKSTIVIHKLFKMCPLPCSSWSSQCGIWFFLKFPYSVHCLFDGYRVFVIYYTEKRGEALEPKLAHRCRSLSRFLQHEAARIISTSPGRDAGSSQVTSPTICQYTVIHLGGERHCESKVSCPRTRHNVPGRGSNPDLSLRSRAH